MKIGFIGAGKAGCSLGKYFAQYGQRAAGGETVSKPEVTGYYSLVKEDAMWAAQFTDSAYFQSTEEVIAASDAIILSTPDGAVKNVWNALDKKLIAGKMICHLSGSLSSDVFSGCGDYGAYPISIHPMFAFSDKESVYQQLHQAGFTLEGHVYAVDKWKALFGQLGNAAIEIAKEVKPKYHAAASILSNHVIAVLATGYELLMECGFSEMEARSFTQTLVRDNVEHVIQNGAANALTGPIERGDAGTVEKHLAVLNAEQKRLYRACGMKLLEIIDKKHNDRDYTQLQELLKE